MEYNDVGDTVTISATFTVRDDNGQDVPTNPASVTLRVRNPATGVIDTPTPGSDVEGTWTYDLELTDPGDWRYEFLGQGNADGLQGGIVRARPSLMDAESPATFVTPDDIETALRRPMTIDEYDAADQLINQLVRTLEVKLNRDLIARTYTDEKHVIVRPYEPLLWHGPVGDILSISVGGASMSFDADSPWSGFGAGQVLRVTYTTDPTQAGDLSDVRGVAINAIVRTLLQGPSVSSGAIKSYSVEGTSITYGDNTAGGQGGRVTVGDLSDIMRRKRRVIL